MPWCCDELVCIVTYVGCVCVCRSSRFTRLMVTRVITDFKLIRLPLILVLMMKKYYSDIIELGTAYPALHPSQQLDSADADIPFSIS